MNTPHIYLNGRILPEAETHISPYDLGLLRGYAVFDLLRTVDGEPFLLAEHLRRLRASAATLNLTVPVSDDEIRDVIRELLRLNGHAEATVRLLLTGGVSPDGMRIDPSAPTFMIMTRELHEPAAAIYETGGKLVTELHQREAPLAKTTNYVTKLRHQARCDDEGALDLLYHDGDLISEAASASFYVVRDGRIHAPGNDVLWGTVGSLVLERAKEKFEVVIGDVSVEDVYSADEAFLTSTTRGVVPIVQVDDRTIGDGRPGPVTREMIRIYGEALSGR